MVSDRDISIGSSLRCLSIVTSYQDSSIILGKRKKIIFSGITSNLILFPSFLGHLDFLSSVFELYLSNRKQYEENIEYFPTKIIFS